MLQDVFIDVRVLEQAHGLEEALPWGFRRNSLMEMERWKEQEQLRQEQRSEECHLNGLVQEEKNHRIQKEGQGGGLKSKKSLFSGSFRTCLSLSFVCCTLFLHMVICSMKKASSS